MKKYLGVKIIQAEPMNKGEAFNRDLVKVDTATELTEEQFEKLYKTDGYKVVYGDDYISWSPKEVFEIAYKEVGNFDYLKTIDVHPNGNWNFMSQEYSISDCCDDSCDNTCESIN